MRALRLLTPRGRGTLLVGLALLAAGLGFNYVLVGGLGAVLAGLVIVEWIAVGRTPDLVVTRTLYPEVVTRNDECTATMQVHGSLRHGLVRTEAGDLVDGALIDIPLPTSLAQRRGPEPTATTYALPTNRRGLHQVGPLQLRRSGLTGMAERTTTSGTPSLLRVLPRKVPLHVLPAGRRRSVIGGDDSAELGGTDLVDLHEYVMGDDLRRLHWATSARTGVLMVREDADPAEPHVSVLLDDLASGYPTAEGAQPESFEDAVEFTAALCSLATNSGNPLRLRFSSSREEIVVAGSLRREGGQVREIDWLLAEIMVTDLERTAPNPEQEPDISVVITGDARTAGDAERLVGTAPTRVICVVQDNPTVAVSQSGASLTLNASSSTSLARLWDEASR